MPTRSRIEPQVTLTELYHLVANSIWEALDKTLQLLPGQKVARSLGFFMLSLSCYMPISAYYRNLIQHAIAH